jgi:hypothetical protein
MTEQIDQNEELGAEVQAEDPASVEDFIKSLEAREKDLDISSELVIEVAEADFDDMNIPDFILDELKNLGKRMVRKLLRSLKNLRLALLTFKARSTLSSTR